MKQIDEILPKISLFASISLEEIWLISPFIRQFKLDKDEYIIKQGEKAAGVYIIRSGSIHQITRLPNDIEIHLATLGPYDFLGEAALINSNASTFSAKTTTPVEGYILSREYLDSLRIAYPDIGHHITCATMTILSERLMEVDQQIIEVLSQIEVDQITSKSRFFNLKLPMQRSLKSSEPKLDPSITMELFNGFSTDEQDFLTASTHLVGYDKGTILLREHKPEEYIYSIIQGAIEETFIQNGKIAKLYVYSPGQIIGQNSFLSFPVRSTRFTVREDATLLALNKQHAEELRQENRLFWYKLYHNISMSYTNKLVNSSKLLKRLHSEFGYSIKKKKPEVI